MVRNWRAVLRGGAILLVAAVMAFGVWLRITSIDAIPDPNGDEAYYGLQAARLAGGEPFTMITGNGNLMDPFLFFPEALLLRFHAPTAVVMRLPSVGSGLLTILLAWLLLRRSLDRSTAAVATILFAAWPGAIVMARYGFETSQEPLAGLIVLHFALRGRPFATLAAFVVALVVHPVDIFLMPVALPVLVATLWRKTADDPARRRRMLGLTLGGVIAVVGGFTVYALRRPIVRSYLEKLDRPLDWPGYLAGMARFHLMRIESPEAKSTQLHLIALGAIVAILLAVGVYRLIRRRELERLALVGGTLAAISLFHVIAGSDVFSEATYRYGAAFIPPALLSLASLMTALVPRPTPEGEETSRPDWRPLWLALPAALALLVSVHGNWFAYFTGPGKESLWTIQAETKDVFAQALSIARRDYAAQPGVKGDLVVVGEDWWRLRPLEFLSAGRKHVRIEPYDVHWTVVDGVWEQDQGRNAEALVAALKAGGYAVGRPFGPVECALSASVPHETIRRTPIIGRGGSHPIVLFSLEPAAEGPPQIAEGVSADRRE